MSGTLSIGGKQIFSHSDVTDKVTYGSGIPAGTVVSIVTQVTDTQEQYPSSNSFAKITPLEISIDPKLTNSKFLVQYTITLSTSQDTAIDNVAHIIPYFKVNSGGSYSEAVRASSAPPLSNQTQGAFMFDIGDDDLSKTNSITFSHSPTYSLGDSIYYAPYIRIGYADASNIYLNRSYDIAQNSDYNGYFISTATIMEIAQ